VTPSLGRRAAAEALGSFFLFATVIGSGIMADRLSGGNVAIALLGNTLATGTILFVLITTLGPLSGAHMNPVVSVVARLNGDIETRALAIYPIAQLAGGITGVWVAHVMFDLPVIQFSQHGRTGIGQWTGEFVATFGLILTILGTARQRPEWVPASVAFYITAAYWFTSSTSFANPAITVARSLSNTFAGIAPADVPGFVVAQLIGGLTGAFVARSIFGAGARPRPQTGQPDPKL
jgi:glycerol uptake facilitator-like aquaporin